MAAFDKWLTGLPADATVADAARIAIGTRSSEMASRLELAAAGVDQDREHVHQLRVASRRTAAVLKTFQKVLPERRADRLSWSARISRRAAGPARDLDVFLIRLEQENLLPGLQGRLYALREEAQSDIVRAFVKLDGGEQVRRQAAKLVARLPADHKQARRLSERSFADWAAERLRREADRFGKSAPAAGAPVEELHAFRIAAKRLRYALEVLAAGIGMESSKAAYSQLKKAQDRLGAINDHATWIVRLRDVIEQSRANERAGINDLIQYEEQCQSEAIAAFHKWWRPKRAAKLAGLLGQEPADDSTPETAPMPEPDA
ncbi:CHAD domain protein [Posidoniimonas polymericola]|uniref:CHAD domain protein n=1 Tax=Posidoniimonas polymericola TaxID=2528002 RepID=A0A5C5Y091_9BACT|nr:CHAD domain-containing protein [Posidoniimonas polymericola]TWT67645.1 CHAD domain protein [Posidoniimonas polymericola]